MDAAFAAAAEGAPDGTAIVAAVQTGGRGSRGQRWASPEGGLWLSVLRRPACAEALPLTGIRAGLAAAAAMAAFDDLPPLQLKWPNDLLVSGRKVGGVLCETQWNGAVPSALVIGIGINVCNAAPDDARWPAASLADWSPALRPDAVLAALLPGLRALDLRHARLGADELAAFARRDALAGRMIAAPVAGAAAGIAADGRLRITGTDGREHVVRVGPVVPVASPPIA